jgi:hypothetical protein
MVVQGPVLLVPCCHVTVPLQLFKVRIAASPGQTMLLSTVSALPTAAQNGWSSTTTVTEFELTAGQDPFVLTVAE